MSDWASLKAKRSAKPSFGVSAPAPSAPNRPPTSPSATSSKLPGSALTSPSHPPNPSELNRRYPDLPNALEVRQLPGRGRGAIAAQHVAAGSTLIATRPLLSVLDNRNLYERCSSCFVSSADAFQGEDLLQCSICKSIRYCSAACQKKDWTAGHKAECKAFQAFHKIHSGVPDTPVRALGRLLWMSARDSSVVSNINSMQSHRESLSEARKEEFFKLSMAVSHYVGQEVVASTCTSAADLLDLCSRFASNSFSLTSPHLSNIGVSVSPLVALLNHSCSPNAAVVFPSFPSSSNLKYMRVVAIKPIQPGREVLTSYVDLGLTRSMRRSELAERYGFECECELCLVGLGAAEGKVKWVDPREAVLCAKKGCKGLVSIQHSAISLSESTCSECQTPGRIDTLALGNAMQEASKMLAKAELLQYEDPKGAAKILLVAMEHLTARRLAPSSQPLLAILQTRLASLLHSAALTEALPVSHIVWSAVVPIYPFGHPVRAIAAATVAKLHVAGRSEGDEQAYWSDRKGLEDTLKVLELAIKEVQVAFGGDGLLRDELRDMVGNTEEGLRMAEAAHRVGKGV